MSDPNNYTIGWISAIEIEYAAAQEFLDDEHQGPKWVHQNDENHYTLGRIGNHNVVIAVLPRGDNGVAAAAMAAKDMMHTFPNVRVCLMVGIGGGAPSDKHDIRLGDVVVSVPTFSEKGGNQGGVIQYDYGRTIQEKCFQGARYLNRPPRALLTAVTGLSTTYKRRGNDIDTTINNILQKNQRLQKEYGRPDPCSDKLYESKPIQALGSDENPASKLIERPKRTEKEDNPAIHYGLVASADGFMEDAQIRDILAKELDVLCFEMEAAGLMNSFPCLVIRGICDYSDRHWFKEWRGYAAMTAAAYAKALLNVLPASDVDKMQTIRDFLPPDIVERAKNFIAPLWADKKKKTVSVSVMAAPEEIQTTDGSKDQSHQTPPSQTAAVPSPSTGCADPEETQTTDRSEDQMLPSQTEKPLPAKTEPKHVYIAVMGVTGAGKSSLISLCTGKNVKIGHNLESCTADVEDVTFMLNDYVVHLIDTPGFDDTSRSDVEVLQNIAVWLSDSFEHGTKLSGIIYLHRIIDVRMAGSALRNLSMFKKLCGEEAYSSVVLATSMWGHVDEVVGAKRERELIETKKFWGFMHEKGSRIFRLEQTRESCLEIIEYILSLGSTTVLELQDEIVNQGRQIEDTEAGVQLNEDIIRERKKHQAELLDLKTQMQEMAEHDAELQRALKEEYEGLKEDIRRNDEEQAKLKQDLKDVHERKEREFLELKKQMEADRKKHEDDMRRQMDADRKKYEDDMRRQMDADRKKYKDDMRNQKEALERQAKENADREKTRAQELENRIRRMEEHNRNQKETLDRQAKENAAREKAWVDNGDTPLHLAASDGRADMARSLLNQGANIEAKNKNGFTPLLLAAWYGKADVAKLLLAQGANIEAKQGDGGDTALHIAACNGKEDMVTFLLDHRANIEARNNYGRTPLFSAAWSEKANVARLLLARGANIEAKQSDNGDISLHIAAWNGSVAAVNLLLDLGANIEAKKNDGDTPLHGAWKGGVDIVGLLLNRGANIEATNNYGRTPLYYAAWNGKSDVAKLLLARGANIEAKVSPDGDTSLHIAAWNGEIDAVKLLLDLGANIEAKKNDGDTPLHLAWNGGVDMVELLLNRGANIEATNNYGRTPLYYAAWNGKADVARLLLARGANIEAKQCDNGDTSLHIAAWNGSVAAVNLLLDLGANIEATKGGETALQFATRNGQANVANLLRARGARG